MLGLTLALGVPTLVLHMLAVCLSRALRTYSRSRLEEICQARGHPERSDEIAHLDERTERSAEALSTITGLGLAALLGATTAQMEPGLTADAVVSTAILSAAVGHVLAAVVGRVHAENVLDRFWPWSSTLRKVTAPLTWLARATEAYIYRRTSRRRTSPPRPASVEVEVHSADVSEEHTLDADLPVTTRTILERAVELARSDIRSLITPRSGMQVLPVSATVREVIRTVVDTGFSRIPLFGEHRDDIVGILYAKDLFEHLLDPSEVLERLPLRKVARPCHFVPESKNATELLEEFRNLKTHMAIVLDEYGTVVGLITLEDLLEELVGPIEDEHDRRHGPEPIVALGDGQYEVDAAVSIEELNERLNLDLPTDEDYSTVGGLTFSQLGHLPQPDTSFRFGGIEFTVLSVKGHSIRRLRVNLHPSPAETQPSSSVGSRSTSSPDD